MHIVSEMAIVGYRQVWTGEWVSKADGDGQSDHVHRCLTSHRLSVDSPLCELCGDGVEEARS